MDRIPDAELHLGTEGWYKPWSGHNGGACVEVKWLGDGLFAMRQSTDPRGPALLFTERELDMFAQGWDLHKDTVRLV